MDMQGFSRARVITSTDPLSSIILLLQCWSHSKQSPPQLQGTEAMLPTREEPQHRTVVQAAFRRTPFHGAPRVWAGLKSAQHQPSLCTPSPAHSCSGSSLQLSRISQGLCLCGIQPYSPRMCSQPSLASTSATHQPTDNCRWIAVSGTVPQVCGRG